MARRGRCGAGQWLKCRLSDGRKAYGVPSQRTRGRFYLVTCSACDCEDAQRHPGTLCKHVLAVRLHVELAKAQGALSIASLRERGVEALAVATLAALVGSAEAVRPVASLGEDAPDLSKDRIRQ